MLFYNLEKITSSKYLKVHPSEEEGCVSPPTVVSVIVQLHRSRVLDILGVSKWGF